MVKIRCNWMQNANYNMKDIIHHSKIHIMKIVYVRTVRTKRSFPTSLKISQIKTINAINICYQDPINLWCTHTHNQYKDFLPQKKTNIKTNAINICFQDPIYLWDTHIHNQYEGILTQKRRRKKQYKSIIS